jgi:hypothetical protein
MDIPAGCPCSYPHAHQPAATTLPCCTRSCSFPPPLLVCHSHYWHAHSGRFIPGSMHATHRQHSTQPAPRAPLCHITPRANYLLSSATLRTFSHDGQRGGGLGDSRDDGAVLLQTAHCPPMCRRVAYHSPRHLSNAEVVVMDRPACLHPSRPPTASVASIQAHCPPACGRPAVGWLVSIVCLSTWWLLAEAGA